jgi:hypothetical protein
MSEPLYNQVVITSEDDTTSRVLLGAPVGGLNEGVTTASQGLLVPDPIPTTLPQLTATVYYFGVPLDPQPSVFWDLSCGANVATIDQSGNITRATNDNAFSYDSNGGVSVGQIGSLVQVTATVIRADGSLSGCRGTLNVTIQAQAPRQYVDHSGNSAAASSPSSAAGFYDLVS